MSGLSPLLAAAEMVFGASPAGAVVLAGESGECVFANRAMADLLGGGTGGPCRAGLRDPGSWGGPGFPEDAGQTLGDGVARRREIHLPAPDGQLRTVDLAVSRFLDGAVPYLLVIASDRTGNGPAEQALAVREAELRTLVENIPDLIVRYDRQLCRTYVNPAWEQASGLTAAEVIQVPVDSIPKVPAATHTGYLAKLRRVLDTGSPQREEFSWVNARGERLYLEYVLVPEHDRSGAITGVLAVGHDLTARKRAEDQLVHRTQHDDLTGLPNRTRLLAHLQTALTRRRSRAEGVAVLFIDLDGFKEVNDSLGHLAGDEFLVKVAGLIAATLRGDDLVARVGGDEFVVVCEGLGDLAAVGSVAERMQRALTTEFVVRGQLVTAPASIGIVFGDEDSTPETLLRDADAAMYLAKRRGGRRYEAAGTPSREAVLPVLTVDTELRRALHQGELAVYYQPLIDLTAERVTSVEALLRWRHPERGMLLPEAFVDVAEQRGLITEIGESVLRTACTRAAGWWERHGPAAPRLSVNVSSRQLGGQGLVDQVHDALAVSGLPGERLCLEITESQLLIIDDAAVDDLRDLTARGVRLAIDDFGTGRTGFDYLRRLPVTELKIDKSFVGGLVVDPTHTAITASMVALGLGLGLEVVAEGIETREQLQALRTMGCTTGQGWYWYPALPADDLDTVLDDILDAGSGPRAVRERAAHRPGVKTHRRSTLYRE